MPVVDFNTAQGIILTRFNAQWAVTHPSDVPVAWPNSPFDPANVADYDPLYHIGWVRITVLPGESFQASMSGATKRWRTPGEVIVQVFTPAGTDEENATHIADDAVAALRGVTVSGLVLTAATPIVVGMDPTGAWYQINVRTVFRYDTLQT